MQESVNPRRNPLGRKILTITFLPIITFIWMTGWILIQIGSQGKATEVSRKTLYTHPEFKVHKKESKTSDEDSKVVYENKIIS